MPADARDTLPPDVESLQPAARFVYRELVDAGHPLDYDDLRDRTGLSDRGVRRAVEELEDVDRATRRPAPSDPRRRVVTIADTLA